MRTNWVLRAPRARTRVAVPEPTKDPMALLHTVKALKEGFEMHDAQRGDPLDWPVTYLDLVRLGIITLDDVPPKPKK